MSFKDVAIVFDCGATNIKVVATNRLEVAEFSAKSLTMGTSLGKIIPINFDQVEELRKEFLSK